MINIVAAMDLKQTIGLDGGLPFRNPVDMKLFRKLTLNHPVVMGRKTFESLGKPLVLRDNIVLTRNKRLKYDGAICMTLENFVKVELPRLQGQDIFIIGGAEVYSLFINIADKMYLTVINTYFIGDTYFPQYDTSQWKLVNLETSKEGNCSFMEYDKIQ